MRARDVVGRRIVAIKQERCSTNYDARVYHVHWIELDNGARIYFSVSELDSDYAVLAHVAKPRLHKKTP